MINVHKHCCTCIMERAVEIRSLSIVNAVIKAKIVRWSSMLLSIENCLRSEEGRVLARKRKDNGVNEKAHHWVFSRCFAGACQAHKYNNLVFRVLGLLWNELLTACMCVIWPLLKVYFMYDLIGLSGWTWFLELSPPVRHYLWLSKPHKSLTLNQGANYMESPSTLCGHL